MGEPDVDLNYIWYQTLDEMLMSCIQHCELARHADGDLALWVQLKMASRALRCALEVYGSQIEKVSKGKPNEKHV